MSTSTARIAKPQLVMADWKARSRTSPLEMRKRDAARGAVTDVTFAVSTGCGPGISGRGNAGLAIPFTVAKSCYKGVKMGRLFHGVPGSPSITFALLTPAQSG